MVIPWHSKKNLLTYQSKLPEMSQHEGKFALIHGEEIVDFFSTYEDAIKAGYQKFGTESFLVKRVQTTEPVFFISRSIKPLKVA